MEKTNIFIALFILFFTVSCNDSEYIAPDELSDVSWYTSIFPGQVNQVAFGKSVSFMDLSQGSLTHEWTIYTEDSTYFMNSGFQPSWGADTLKLHINRNANLNNTDPTVHVLFRKEGNARVRFRNTFSSSVSYKGTIPRNAVKEGNVWVLDTTLVFTVKAPVVTP